MQQSSAIFANLLIAYLLFITLKGELPTYLTLLRGGGQQPAAGAGGSGSGGIGGLASSLINSASGDNSSNDVSISPSTDSNTGYLGFGDNAAPVDYLTQLTSPHI